MKRKIILLTLTSIVSIFSFSQSLEKVKKLLLLSQYSEAKEGIDRLMLLSKFQAIPETYILKSSIYAGIATNDLEENKPTGLQLLNEAFESFNQYRRMDPEMLLLENYEYRTGLLYLYTGFFTSGVSDYNAKDWEKSFQKMKEAVNISDLLIEKKIIKNLLFDTSAIYLTGAAAQNRNLNNEALYYYKRLADSKITGQDYEPVYRFIVYYYASKLNIDEFNKYKALGNLLYPNSEYFTYNINDFQVGEGSFEAKLAKIESEISTKKSYELFQMLGELIYDSLNSIIEYPYKSNLLIDLEEKMISAFNYAMTLQTGEVLPLIYLGNYSITITEKLQYDLKEGDSNKEKHNTINENLEAAKEYFERALAIYDNRKSLTSLEKSQYKNIVSTLISIYSNLKSYASNRLKTDELDQEEKRLGRLYSDIDKNKPYLVDEKKDKNRVIKSDDGIIIESKQDTTIKGGGDYYALIVGVSDYIEDRLDLPNPAKDAIGIQNLLTSSYTFSKENSTLLLNPTRSKILAELFRLRKKITEHDNLLIYFAGHGYWDSETKQGYWWPNDASIDNSSNWLSNSDLRDQIRGIKGKHILLITDACFSGGIFRSRGGVDISSATSDIKLLYSMPSRRAITSGTLTEVPDESVFYRYLSKRLKENVQKFLSSQQLFESFRVAVINNSKVVPQNGIIAETGDEGGDFIFILR